MTDDATLDASRFHTPFTWQDGRILDAKGTLVATFEPTPSAPADTGEVVASQLTDYWDDMNLSAPAPVTPEQRFMHRLTVGLAVVITTVVLVNQVWPFIPTDWSGLFQHAQALKKPY